MLENDIFKFEEQICDWEEELAGELPDKARDKVMLVVGMAKLLIVQKSCSLGASVIRIMSVGNWP